MLASKSNLDATESYVSFSAMLVWDLAWPRLAVRLDFFDPILPARIFSAIPVVSSSLTRLKRGGPLFTYFKPFLPSWNPGTVLWVTMVYYDSTEFLTIVPAFVIIEDRTLSLTLTLKLYDDLRWDLTDSGLFCSHSMTSYRGSYVR